VKRHSVYLRNGCTLPDRLNRLLEPLGDYWAMVKEIPAPVFDTMIRRAGWHFIWMQGSCSRRGFGLTQEDAAHRALARALRGVAKNFDAAELDFILVTKCSALHIANVKLQPRQIQFSASLDIARQTVPAR